MKNTYKVRLFLEESAGVIIEYTIIKANAFRAYDEALERYKIADWDGYKIDRAEVYNTKNNKIVYAVRTA